MRKSFEYQFRRVILRFLNILGVAGCKDLGLTSDGNHLLQLRFCSEIGRYGTRIQVPKDDIIFKQLMLSGSWEKASSRFLSSLVEIHGDSSIGLIDIGANVGLISFQVMVRNPSVNSAYLFEPVQQHIRALEYNRGNFPERRILIFPFGLGPVDSISTIYVDRSNFGHATLKMEEGKTQNVFSELISLKSAERLQEWVDIHDYYILKSDTEGLDAKILSRIPKAIWSRTLGAVVEIQPSNIVDSTDVDILLKIWEEEGLELAKEFNNSFSSLDSVRNYWCGQSVGHTNIFLRRDSFIH